MTNLSITKNGVVSPCHFFIFPLKIQMKGQIPTPGIGLKRKIGEQIKIYNIDEFRTSCINYKTLEYNEHLYLPDKTGKIRKMHSILTYKMENKRKGCINRDNNATNNMVAITQQYLKDKSRPQAFRRDVKPEDIKRPVKLSTRSPNQKFSCDSVIILDTRNLMLSTGLAFQ